MSYLSDIEKVLTPEQYKALVKPMQFQAKKSYKGVPQDWQAQILMPLDVSKLSIPKQLSIIPGKVESYAVQDAEGGYVTKTRNIDPSLDKSISKDYTPLTATVGGGEGEGAGVTTVNGFKSKNPVDVNGVPVYALYDAKGNLTGYEGSSKKRLYVNDSTSYKGVWDATGKQKPKQIVADSGGFFKGIVNAAMSDPLIGAAANAVAFSYGGPQAVAALNATKTAAAGGNLGDVLESGAKAGLLSYGGQQLGQAISGGADVGGADVLGADMGSGGGADVYTGGGISAKPGEGLNLATTTGAPSLYPSGINIADMGGAQGLTTAGTAGGLLGAEGLSAATGPLAAGIGSGLGLTEAATGAGSMLTGAAAAGAGAAGAGALGDLGTAALIKGGVSLAGGLLQGETTKDALTTDAAKRAALAKEVKDMGKFTPVGITTTFGTSNFVTDPVTGTITPSYTLSPAAQAYQNSLGALGTTALSSASDIMNLGKQYIGEAPEAVRQRYIDTQTALLAPGQEQKLAGIRSNQAARGIGGLSFGATTDGMMATNPELAAYYNSLAMTNRQLAADAETQYQNQVNFGTGLMGSATKPFTNVFDAQKSVEAAAQEPLKLSTDFANMAATRGAAQGSNYASAMNPSLESSYKANTYDPLATFLQGMSDSDLAIWGLSKIKP